MSPLNRFRRTSIIDFKLKTNRLIVTSLILLAMAVLCMQPFARVTASLMNRIIGRSSAPAIGGAPILSPPPGTPRSGAIAVVTDQDSIPLSNKFTTVGVVGLADSGDTVIAPGTAALLQWKASDGSRTRLWQVNDPAPDFPNSANDVLGNTFSNSLGHFVMVNNFAAQGQPTMRELLVYDGTTFHPVAKRNDLAPDSGGQTFINFSTPQINNSDQIAFIGNLGTTVAISSGVYTVVSGSTPVKVATQGDAAPGGGTFVGNFSLIGINSSGDVAFGANVQNGPTVLGIFIKNASGLHKVVAVGDLAPGTTGTYSTILAQSVLNDSGDVAFLANVAGGAPVTQGIWIGNAAGVNTKLVVNTDATGTSIGGSYSGGLTLNGFNSSGKALFQSNVSSGTSAFGLFLKDLTTPAQIVITRGQAVPGGTTETFNSIAQAALNNNSQVAFQAGLTGGPLTTGYFLGSGTSVPSKIALPNEATPAGGTFIGTTALGNFMRINNNNQVIFQFDISGTNAGGTFLFTPGSGIRSIVTTDDDLPSGANVFLRTFGPAGSNDRVVFLASKAGGRWGFFTKPLPGVAGSITTVATEGDPAPGMSGALWRLAITNNVPMINNQNETLLVGNVVGPSIATTIVFTHKPGVGLRKVVANGDPVPGGGTFQAPSTGSTTLSRINSQGKVAFFAPVAGGQSGVFIGSGGGPIVSVARNGDAAFAGSLSGLSNTLSLNDLGQVAFRANSGTTDALFVGDGSSTAVKVVAKGDAAPTGGTINVTPQRFQLNNNGQLAYVPTLSGGTAAKGVFVSTVGGAPQKSRWLAPTLPAPGPAQHSAILSISTLKSTTRAKSRSEAHLPVRQPRLGSSWGGLARRRHQN
jgi:hypothetical protein